MNMAGAMAVGLRARRRNAVTAAPRACGSPRCGQAALEYLLTVSATITMIAILAVLLYAVREHGSRVLALVVSDYP